jgi:hypothetical protein
VSKDVVPANSRYIPFTQQAQCCAPTCIQMVMYKNEIPLVSAELLGYHLGLVVPPSEARLFYNVRTSEAKPTAGYGTRIYMEEFSPNKAFKNLNIPLTLNVNKIANFNLVEEVTSFLAKAEKENRDVLFCFNHGALIDDSTRDWGHLTLFDRLIDNKIRIIDPSPTHPKWRLVTPEKMFYAMKKHGEKPTAAGLWELNRASSTIHKLFLFSE